LGLEIEPEPKEPVEFGTSTSKVYVVTCFPVNFADFDLLFMGSGLRVWKKKGDPEDPLNTLFRVGSEKLKLGCVHLDVGTLARNWLEIVVQSARSCLQNQTAVGAARKVFLDVLGDSRSQFPF
jgi:hypothetical protein